MGQGITLMKLELFGKKVISKDLWLTMSPDFFLWGLLKGKIATKNIVMWMAQQEEWVM
jgi:hypothetical protein